MLVSYKIIAMYQNKKVRMEILRRRKENVQSIKGKQRSEVPDVDFGFPPRV